MNIQKQIPNFLTLCNLFCGCLGLASLDVVLMAWMILVGLVFDFADGLTARALKAQSELGKQLDSLADLVTFGVLPGMIVYHLLNFKSSLASLAVLIGPEALGVPSAHDYLPYIAFLVPVFSAIRLAKFNIDQEQTHTFTGLPTPASALLIASFPLSLEQYSDSLQAFLLLNPWFWIGFTIFISFLLVSPLRLFSLKFKHYDWVGNEVRYIFLLVSLVLLIFLQFLAVPLVIVLYLLLSLLGNAEKAQNSN